MRWGAHARMCGLGILQVILVVAGHAQTICVRPIFPFGDKQAATKLVLQELLKKHVSAIPCGEKPESIEVYFYPLRLDLSSDQTTVWVSEQQTSTGVVATVDASRPECKATIWVFSMHPNGQEESTHRVQGAGLRSQAGKIGKWLARHH